MTKSDRFPPLRSQRELDREARPVTALDLLELVVPASYVLAAVAVAVAAYTFLF